MTKSKNTIALLPLLLLALAGILSWASSAPAQNDSALAARIREITSRPEYSAFQFRDRSLFAGR